MLLLKVIMYNLMREVKTKAFLLWVMKQNLERKMLLLLLKTKLLH